jgi:hypothetical protein
MLIPAPQQLPAPPQCLHANSSKVRRESGRQAVGTELWPRWSGGREGGEQGCRTHPCPTAHKPVLVLIGQQGYRVR